MKKKNSVVLVIIVAVVLCVSAWFYGYHNRKSNDNLPALKAIAQMSESDVNSLLPGYKINQLREVWEEPNYSEDGTDIWQIDDVTFVVSYKNNGVVVKCGLENGSDVAGGEESRIIVGIRDRYEEGEVDCADAEEIFYEDENNLYYFGAIKSDYIIVTYKDGSSEDIVTALNAGRVTIADLDEFGIKYDIKQKSKYPLISIDEAKERLAAGHFYTRGASWTYNEEGDTVYIFPGMEYVKSLEVVYLPEDQNICIPYYAFYADAVFFVPAIESQYITNMPVDGNYPEPE